MDQHELKEFIRDIVKKACELKDQYTDERKAQVNYACIFAQGQKKFDEYVETVSKFGKIIKQTPTGPLFHIQPLETIAGNLKLLKIRMPDKTRPEQGDADFTVGDYDKFKKVYLTKKEFKLIERENMEMIELMEKNADVRVYFSNPPLDKQLGL